MIIRTSLCLQHTAFIQFKTQGICTKHQRRPPLRFQGRGEITPIARSTLWHIQAVGVVVGSTSRHGNAISLAKVIREIEVHTKPGGVILHRGNTGFAHQCTNGIEVHSCQSCRNLHDRQRADYHHDTNQRRQNSYLFHRLNHSFDEFYICVFIILLCNPENLFKIFRSSFLITIKDNKFCNIQNQPFLSWHWKSPARFLRGVCMHCFIHWLKPAISNARSNKNILTIYIVSYVIIYFLVRILNYTEISV